MDEGRYPPWRDGVTAGRLGSYLASSPKRAAAVFFVLIVALMLVTAALVLEMMRPSRVPYPSQNLPVELVDGKIVYTQDFTTVIMNETPAESYPYAGMKIVFQVTFANGYDRMPAVDFGNQTLLSAGTKATVHQTLMTSSYLNVSIDITDSTGDGSFNLGDTIVFDIDPLKEDWIYTVGLLWHSPEYGGSVARELSFAIHDCELYAWYSEYLNDTPWYWYDPFLH